MIRLPLDAGLIFVEQPTGIQHRLSDHNRQQIQIDTNRIETRKRMADGTLRSFLVALKKQYKVSWRTLPRQDERTADGFWGAQSLQDFYDSTLSDSFTVLITNGDTTTQEASVMFNSFSCNLNSRSDYTDLYDVDITLDEV